MGGAPGGGPPAFGSGPALGPRVGGGPPMGGMGMGGPRGMGGGAPRGPPPGHGAPTFGNGPPRGPPPFGGGFGGGLKRMSMRAGQAFNAVGNRFRGGLPQPNTNVGAPDSGTITGGPVNGTRNPMAANTGPSFTANKPGGLMNRMSKRMPKLADLVALLPDLLLEEAPPLDLLLEEAALLDLRLEEAALLLDLRLEAALRRDLVLLLKPAVVDQGLALEAKDQEDLAAVASQELQKHISQRRVINLHQQTHLWQQYKVEQD
eukprot:CAMPEP_0204855424 /NCGR_PEP_ID=MMETSP1347-20130617/16794_1 /ASSEMBLY_ACC=CAM_ASM_000690 /TAXON_ID=215587 /ORGANISM="Aplanochytrium stocchinoi, Strain GSBS06" /LENGTH=260 /DNA_ID=CAMNT_0052001555 /DNA_START=12 /DNA_END=795 /DNA_ORIENTATION=-